MSAKFIYSITDENPDLKKQIGCMNGIFQLFDRHRFLSTRRFNGGHNHKTLHQGQNSKKAVKPKKSQQKIMETNTTKVVKENRRISTESSRTSFSSSSCSSSFSSIDYNRANQTEPSHSSQTSFVETPTRDLLMNKPNATMQSSWQSLDICDVVRESMHREVRGVSVRTAAKETVVQTLKYIDSPRPSQPQKPVKSRFSGVNESLRGYEEKDGFTHSSPRERRRLSYDGKESRDTHKSTIKLKELPRLSLDSRERSIRGATCESKLNYLQKDLHQEKMNCNEMLNLPQEPGSSKRPSCIVAKLMGLEAFPDSMSTPGKSLRITSTCQTDKYDQLERSSQVGSQNMTGIFPGSSRNSLKAVSSLQMKNADLVAKATLGQQLPIETAPWRHSHGSRGSQPPSFKCQEGPTATTSSSASVYGEIVKRLTELEFKTSAKDLRALQQILEAMQKSKGISMDKKDKASSFSAQMGNNSSLDHSAKLAIQSNLQSNSPCSPRAKASKSPKSIKSSIVIMKPAKLVEKNADPTSTRSSNDNLFGLPKLQTNDLADNRKNDANKRTVKSVTQRRIQVNHINRQHPSMNKFASTKTSKMSRNNSEDNDVSSGKTSGTLSPRLQQRRFAMERQACLPIPLDSSKTRRQQSRQPIESGSPGRQCRPKTPNPQQRNDHWCKSSASNGYLSHQDDDSSLRSESNASITDNEVTNIIQSAKTSDTCFKHKQKQKNPAARLSENRTNAEPAKAISEQPSPVSVLDAAFYRDESPSPVKKTSNVFKDDDALYADEVDWNTEDPAEVYTSRKSSLSAEIDHKLLENISLFVQNPQQMNCNYKQSIMCPSELQYDSTNPDHIYILYILSASGLLRNLNSDLTDIQSQPAEKLINPNLFLELEKIKESTQFLSNDYASKMVLQPIPDQKIQRKLLFDVVNEIVVRKLVVQDSFKQWFSPVTKPMGQQLLRELCSEVDRLQNNNSNRNQDNEDDSLESILCEDMMLFLLNWTDCRSEIPEVVLDIERLIFKDLITEVVSREAAGLRGRLGDHRRQLFSK